MDKRLNQLGKTREKITHICKLLSWVFVFFFVIYCLAFMFVIWISAFPPAGFSYIGPSNILFLIPIICNIVAGGIAVFVIMKMLRMVGNGMSPFSLASSRQIKALAIVLMVGVIAGAFMDPGMQVGSASESGSIAFESVGNEDDISYIDLKSLFISIICFALSPIFRYGALLQSEADDLM